MHNAEVIYVQTQNIIGKGESNTELISVFVLFQFCVPNLMVQSMDRCKAMASLPITHVMTTLPSWERVRGYVILREESGLERLQSVLQVHT